MRLSSVIQMGEADQKALDGFLRQEAKEDMRVCEVGSWKGGSTEIIADVVKKYNGSVYCVDHWQGSPGTGLLADAQKEDIFQVFMSNMRKCGLEDTVKLLVMSSLDAASMMADKVFDVVFIDADHRYTEVKADILAWLPKVKDGGLLCGHDCEVKF